RLQQDHQPSNQDEQGGHQSRNLRAQALVEGGANAGVSQEHQQRLQPELACEVGYLEQQNLQTLRKWEILAQDPHPPVGNRSILSRVEQIDKLALGQILDACKLLVVEIETSSTLEQGMQPWVAETGRRY